VDTNFPQKSWESSNYPRWEKFTGDDIKNFVNHDSISIKRIAAFGKYIGHDENLEDSILIDRIRVKNFPWDKPIDDLP
jgi:hypothetical protein